MLGEQSKLLSLGIRADIWNCCPRPSGLGQQYRYTAGHVRRHQYVLLPGIVSSVFDRTLLPGFIQLRYLQTTYGLDTARVSIVYFRA
ncbi:hypothetical protein DPMN_073021 [Dreissena polymorpha]|uniref:Uncharacterized protein n=1 Tax=Dreissena polymorpha TaxID=45954 RepID=A0A9D4HAB1_DREPO|nr:hypothetical protein DPMN_073021 [Dreissena polymorpha]